MILTLDFETYYTKEYNLKSLSIQEYVEDKRFHIHGVSYKIKGSKSYWTTDVDKFIKSVERKYGWKNITVVCQNAYFDVFILAKLGVIPGFIRDVMGMAKSQWGGSVSLKSIGKRIGQSKGDELIQFIGKRYLSDAELKTLGDYCINDTDITDAADDVLFPLMAQTELELIDITIRMFTEPVIMLNKELLEQELKDVIATKEEVVNKIRHILDYFPRKAVSLFDEDTTFEDIVSILSSNEQFAFVVANELDKRFETYAQFQAVEDKVSVLGEMGFPLKKSLTTGKLTLATAKKDAGMMALPEKVQPILDARFDVKLTLPVTRTKSLIALSDYPLPIYLRYFGARTGRYSGGEGINLQNLPRGSNLRLALEAPKGYVLGICDASQIEARVNAWLAWKVFGGDDGAYNLLETFRTGGDPYCSFASVAFDREITKADKFERFMGKQCVLGLGYQMSGPKLQFTIAGYGQDVPLGECERLKDVYRSTYYQIPQQWYALQDIVTDIFEGNKKSYGPIDIEKGRIRLPNSTYINYSDLQYTNHEKYGRQYYYQNREKRVTLYGGKLTENIIQALARIIVCDQLVTIGKYYKIAFQVHDEIVAIIPEKEAEQGLQLMLDIMCEPPEWGTDIPLDAEGGYSKNYSK